MELTFKSLDEFQIIDVSGVVDSKVAGRLLDALVEATQNGDRLIVDLSRVQKMTRAGVRGLVVAAKLSVTGGGRLRICGASPSVEGLLRSLGYGYLLRFDRTVEASIAALSARAARRAA